MNAAETKRRSLTARALTGDQLAVEVLRRRAEASRARMRARGERTWAERKARQ
jgi:hypothetical protein